ncbi:MAG: histidinol-phosphatase [Dehalococcoidia bacterium]|nr:histidinol-phosphatase [Dehalococcoidia bacterium]
MLEPTTAQALDFALALAAEADAIALRTFRSPRREAEVRVKADGTLVTRADTAVEAMLRREIAQRFLSYAVLGEEQGYVAGASGEAGNAPRWVIDPIDGTHNFVRGIPIWATLIAFQRGGVVEAGVASAPALGWRWWAGRELGAYRAPLRDGAIGPAERIHVSDGDTIAEAQVLYGSYPLTLDAWGGRAEGLLRACWRARGFGDFWGHCLVAEGAAEVMLEGEIKPWDIAALLPIIEEAGGRLTDIEGRTTIEAGHSITTNGVLHDDVLRRLRA